MLFFDRLEKSQSRVKEERLQRRAVTKSHTFGGQVRNICQPRGNDALRLLEPALTLSWIFTVCLKKYIYQKHFQESKCALTWGSVSMCWHQALPSDLKA